MNINNNGRTKWLVLFFIHLTKDYDEYANNALAEIKNCGVNRHELLVIIDNTFGESKTRKKGSVLRRLVGNTETPGSFHFEDEEIDFTYTNAACWEKLLGKINADNRYQTERSICITLSHSAGFAFTEKNPLFNNPDNEDNPDYCKTFKALWMDGLANALERGFGNRKIDLFLMANCHMQTFETGWLLRKQVNYLVASQTFFEALGFSYAGLLEMINKNPEIPTTAIAHSIIPQFRIKWDGYNDDFKNKFLPKANLVVADLQYYDAIMTLLDKAAEVLINLSESEIQRVVEARNDLVYNVSNDPLTDDPSLGYQNSTALELVDMGRFLEVAANVLSSHTEMKDCYDAYRQVVKKCILDKYIGPVLSKYDSQTQKKYGFTGISIHLPSNWSKHQSTYMANCAYLGKLNETIPWGIEPTLSQFLKNSKWEGFVKRYTSVLLPTLPA